MSRFIGRTAIAALALLGVSTFAFAHDYTLKSLSIAHPYARATAPGAPVGAAYLGIENKGSTPDTLVAAKSPIAGTVQIHEMSMDGGMMKMRALPNGLPIPAGGKVSLAPSGYHIMLMNLKQPLVAGQSFPLTLTFAKAGSIDVDVNVESMGAMGAGGDPMKGMPGMGH
ncbi:MAG: copper chaperone PCu(A)C [Proteobacteria bacterium]|nr:copper chaperone PCu(A)C [Pseudomonadota bacterium]